MSDLLLPEPRRPAAAPPWMLSFADLLSLLLSFFVMLLATSSIDRETWALKLAPLTQYLGGHAVAAPGVVVEQSEVERHDPAYLAALVEARAATLESLHGAVVSRAGRDVVLTLPSASADQMKAEAADLGPLVGALQEHAEIALHATASTGWTEPLARAESFAALLGHEAGGRAVASSLTLDLPEGTPERLDLVIGSDHGAL